MASALLRLTGSDEIGHAFEDLVCSSQIFEDKMSVMDFEEPMVQLVLLVRPMALLRIFGLLFSMLKFNTTIFFLSLLLIFLASKANMTLLPKERLKVVTRNNFLIIGGIINLGLMIFILAVILVDGILHFQWNNGQCGERIFIADLKTRFYFNTSRNILLFHLSNFD